MPLDPERFRLANLLAVLCFYIPILVSGRSRSVIPVCDTCMASGLGPLVGVRRSSTRDEEDDTRHEYRRDERDHRWYSVCGGQWEG